MRQPFINERPLAASEPEVVPIMPPVVESAPPRRFAPLASIEPEVVTPDPEPEQKVHHVAPVEIGPKPQPLADLGINDEDDLDVPAFIRRKVQ
jgi:hypothetical protein